MFSKIKRIFIGKPLDSDDIESEKYGVAWGLPILSSDAISSVAYAGQEMLAVLIPAIGILAYRQMTFIAGAIIVLLFTLMLSYRQTIDCYPNGGGAYTVAKENIGTKVGVVAGSALSIGYILTVSVSISSGVQQIASAFEPIRDYKVAVCVVLVLVMALWNLRGIREASKSFGLPTYAFVFGILIMIITGFVRLAQGYQPPEPTFSGVAQPLTTILMLKAFSNGCTALTGVEAVSNGVPNFKEPAAKHAKTVLLLLSLIFLALFGGTAVLANFYKVVPGEDAMLVLIAGQIFGGGFMYYYVTVTTFIILVIAANTAFAGFPVLISVMSKDGYMPRQLNMRGVRLSYDSGIILLALAAIALIILFRAEVRYLIGLYAVGVFLSFTLSQAGMFLRWMRTRERYWGYKALINGIGALMTLTAVVIVAITKFDQGVWLVALWIPLTVTFMLKIKKHYAFVHDQLRLEPEEYLAALTAENIYKNRVIVPVESVNRASIRALRYAKTISDNIVAFNVVIDKETGEKNRQRFAMLQTDIPLVIKYSPYRQILEPLLDFIKSEEYGLSEGEIVSVILPQFRVQKLWQHILHNNTRFYIQRELLKHKQIAICTIPLQLSGRE